MKTKQFLTNSLNVTKHFFVSEYYKIKTNIETQNAETFEVLNTGDDSDDEFGDKVFKNLFTFCKFMTGGYHTKSLFKRVIWTVCSVTIAYITIAFLFKILYMIVVALKIVQEVAVDTLILS